MLELPVIVIALFLVALVTTGLALYALVNMKVRGALEFCVLMFSLTFYIAGFGFELLSPSRSGVLFWLKIEYIGISTIPAFCVLLAIRLAGKETWLKPWPVKLTLFFPLINLLVYYSNDLHHLFYKSIGELNPAVPYSEVMVVRGIWYYLNIIYLNLCLLAGVVIFARRLNKGVIERRQAWIMIAGSLGPWAAHLFYQLGFSNGLDISPFGFLITAPLFAWGIFGNYVVFFLPKARESVYQSFRDAVFIFDSNKILIDFNKVAGNLFKTLNAKSIGIPGREVFDAYPLIVNLIDGEDDQRIQVKFEIDRVYRSFVVNNASVNNRKGNNLGLILVFHEITDQVFLLDNLRESEEKYRLIFEHSPVGILQYDISGKIIMCNDAFVKIIGSSKEVLVGLNMLKLPDQILVSAVADSLKGHMGYYEHEYHSVTAPKITPVRGLFTPITAKDGKIRGGVGIIEDYTDRFKADEEIKNREEFENILIKLELDFLNTEVGEIDNSFNKALSNLGTYCKVDRAYIFQYDSVQNLMRTTHEWCVSGVRSMKESLGYVDIKEFPKWAEKLLRFENIYIPDLSELTAEWNSEREKLESLEIKSLIIVPIRIGSTLLGFTGFDTVYDSRTWSREEIALLQVLGKVFASVIKMKETNEELLLARDRAEAANQVKSAFLANMSHEIRTPLSGLLGFAELIQAEANDDEILRYADIIVSSGTRLMQTLSQILDLSRIESGKMELVIEQVDVNKAIDEVIFLFAPNAKKKGLFIERQVGGPQMVLSIDFQLFSSSLTNLISNAIKFSEKGGITVSTSMETVNGRNFGIIRVADTGIGIPEQYFEKIFEDFQQVSEGMKKNYEGTGLGLSLTKKFVELSGGSIQVESMPGFGTTFIMSFPYQAGE